MKKFEPTRENWAGRETNFQFEVTDEDFVQAKGLWDVLGRQEGQQDHFVYNVSVHLKDADLVVRQRTYGMFGRVDKVLGERIERATEDLARDMNGIA